MQIKLKRKPKKAKCVRKYVLERSITIQYYKDCLFNKTKQFRKINPIRIQNHQIYIIAQNKIALSGDQNKGHILPNGINN